MLGITLGEYVIGLCRRAARARRRHPATSITIVTSSVGWVGTLVIVLGTIKINDWNLYSSGLGVVNFMAPSSAGTSTGPSSRSWSASLGSVLAAGGILDHFTDFLIVLGVAFPPIAGIMVAEYFVVKRWRPELDATRADGTLPPRAPTWVPATLVIWVARRRWSGKFVTWGLPSINSLVVGFVLYVVAGKLGLIRGVGTQSHHGQ